MKFQFDPTKAKRNFRKHKVSFADAESVFYDPLAIHIEDPFAEQERRWIAIGMGSASQILVVRQTRFDGQPVMRCKIMKKEYDFSKGKRGAIIASKNKTRITIYLDDNILEEFRSRAEKFGTGYQTLINDALKDYISQNTEKPVTEATLRRILHEEFPKFEQMRSVAP